MPTASRIKDAGPSGFERSRMDYSVYAPDLLTEHLRVMQAQGERVPPPRSLAELQRSGFSTITFFSSQAQGSSKRAAA